MLLKIFERIIKIMKILSIDTSSNLCAVAVLEDSNLLKENILNDTKNHSEKIMPVIAQTLEEANLKLRDIDLIVCDKGPGSFTGIRIGVATVMSFVDSLKIPSIGISSLECLLYNVLLSKTNSAYICSLIDAKNDNVYFELYSISDNKATSIISADCKNINELINLLKKYDNICFVGDGAISHQSILNSNLNNPTFSEHNQISSYSLAIAGLHAYSSDRRDNLLPLYLRKSQAERAKQGEQ
jgi:tRNA threonylcarbamoyladenosine biosynthesis protein TsaB